MNVPDHPEIRRCELTGYPSFEQEDIIYCDKCGDEIDGEIYFDDEHESLCEYCLMELHKKGW